jgi:hypothetical protein
MVGIKTRRSSSGGQERGRFREPVGLRCPGIHDPWATRPDSRRRQELEQLRLRWSLRTHPCVFEHVYTQLRGERPVVSY